MILLMIVHVSNNKSVGHYIFNDCGHISSDDDDDIYWTAGPVLAGAGLFSLLFSVEVSLTQV